MDRLIGIDEGALYFFQSLRKGWLDELAADVTQAGDNWALGVAAGVMLLFCLLRGRWQTAAAVALSCCLGLLLIRAAGHFVNRPRPEVANPVIALPSTSSFPSGHALASMATYGIIGLSLAPLFRSRSWQRRAYAGFSPAFPDRRDCAFISASIMSSMWWQAGPADWRACYSATGSTGCWRRPNQSRRCCVKKCAEPTSRDRKPTDGTCRCRTPCTRRRSHCESSRG